MTIVHIEMYFEYYSNGKTSTYRCFVPRPLEDFTSADGIDRAYFLRPRGMIQVAQMANLIVDVANRKVIKDRNGTYMEEFAPGEFRHRQVTDDEVDHFRSVPVVDFDALLRHVERLTRPAITEFTGDYHFLSNFHPAKFIYKGLVWNNSEAAYQAMKTTSEYWQQFAEMTNPGDAKRLGKTVPLRKDWTSVKSDIMREIVIEKFRQNPHLLARLLGTDDAILEEGNTWGDLYWGVCPPDSGRGRNELGKILMKLRSEMRLLGF